MGEKKKYTASREVTQAQEAVQGHQQTRPGAYESPYGGALKDTLDKILNQKDFQYRLDGDALYRRYRDQAVRDGQRAMSDTMGQAAALTGGYGNSYAQSVGQQAYARQMEGLADRIPELYSLAMEQYKLRAQGLKDRYGILSDADSTQYSRYADSLAAWQEEADRLQRQYESARDSDYGAYRDDVADWKWQEEFDENKRRYDQQWEADHPTLTPGVRTVYPAGKEKKEKKSQTFLGMLLGAAAAAAAGRKK